MKMLRLLPFSAIAALATLAPIEAWASDSALGGETAPFRHALSLLVFLPLVGVLAAFTFHRMGHRRDSHLRRLMLAITGAELGLALAIYAEFDPTRSGHQLVERTVFLRSLGAEYFVGVDGISLSLILLTTLLGFVGVLASRPIRNRLATYWSLYCLMLTGMLGVLVALDLLLFFAFWCLSLASACGLVGLFGGPGRRRATFRFAISGLTSSALLLFAFVALYLHSAPAPLSDGSLAPHSFAIPELANNDYFARDELLLGMSFVKVVFSALFVGFALTLAIFPFHWQLVGVLVEAPTAVSLLLAGALFKLGAFGILRLSFALLPEASAWAAPIFAGLGVITILAGAALALRQSDFKRFVAYAAMSQLGFAWLAMASLTPAGIQASVMQMFSHGLITALLFLIAAVLEERVATRDIERFGGLAKEMPRYSIIAGLVFMASIGFPGLSAFIGQTMALASTFPVYEKLTLAAATGMVMAAAYHLRVFQRLFLGSLRDEWRSSPRLEPFGGKLPDIQAYEIASLAPLALLVLALGLSPKPLLAVVERQSIDLANLLRPLGPMQITLREMAEQAIALLQ